MDVVAFVAFERDRHHASDRREVLGVSERGVAVERVDRCEAGVAGSGACCRGPVRGGSGTRRSVARPGRRSPAAHGCLPVCSWTKREQQPERVAVGRRSSGAGSTLGDQPLGEERLECRGEQAHGSASWSCVEAFADERQQLGRCLQVPVRVRRDRCARDRSRAAASRGPRRPRRDTSRAACAQRRLCLTSCGRGRQRVAVSLKARLLDDLAERGARSCHDREPACPCAVEKERGRLGPGPVTVAQARVPSAAPRWRSDGAGPRVVFVCLASAARAARRRRRSTSARSSRAPRRAAGRSRPAARSLSRCPHRVAAASSLRAARHQRGDLRRRKM